MATDAESTPTPGRLSRLRVMMLGLRGFPDVQGGVETHAQHLSTHLQEMGCQVNIIVRSPYHPVEKGTEWRGIRFHRIWAPVSKKLEAIVHSVFGVLYAGVKRPDVLHIHAIGPSLVAPLARLLGLKVVVTHHGPDYERQKWGGFAKFMLEAGERFGMLWSNERIVISQVIHNLVKSKYGKESVLIPNGVVLPELPDTTDALHEFGLAEGKYVLIVSRLVPEKRHLDLISAFAKAGLPDWKLAIVGDSDHPDEYTKSVLAAVNENPSIVATGLQSGQPLRELYAHAGLFVLPSSHEGLPIALLEALSYGLPVIASDIPANLEISLPEQNYFALGDTDMLARRLREFSTLTQTDEAKNNLRDWVSHRYNWSDIARSTLQVYLNTQRKAA
ncbi:MAG: glycosyltransferase family 4 protein [Candidatus Methylumidiphilus sp.]